MGHTIGIGRSHRVAARAPLTRGAFVALVLWALVIGNGAAVLWLWLHGGGLTIAAESLGGLLTSLGRVTALVGTYLVLVQVVLLARVRWIERAVGFDRLTVWHRRNGKVAISLVVIHVPLIVAGYSLTLQTSLGDEISTLYDSYPGMVTATIGTVVLAAVVVSSLVVVRRRLQYEAWYFVHLTVYAGILLAYFHQIPTGNEFSANAVQRDYWYALYALAVALLLGFRVVTPALHFWRHRLRVVEVRREAPRVVSVYMQGRQLDRLGGRGGQFFLWRFLSRKQWWQAHPFSLSAPPDGRSLRITVKGVGDFSRLIGELAPGTAVIAEGPFGTFTPERANGRKAALIAGGIGITPLRAMLDELVARGGAITLIHRVLDEEDLVLKHELAEYADDGAVEVINVVGDHAGAEGAGLLSSQHLRELIPDLPSRAVFLCGPPAMMTHVRAGLVTLGVPDRQIHTERFALAAD